MSARSMTGYARARKMTPLGEIAVSVKSVNHRGLDVHVHAPAELDAFEIAVRNAVKKHASRGHFQINITLVRAPGVGLSALNRPLMEAYLGAFRQCAAEYGLAGEPDLNAALCIPGMLAEGGGAEPSEELGLALNEAIDEAMQAVNNFREREGAAIVADLQARNAAIVDLTQRMGDLRAQAVPAFQARLTERLRELAGMVAVDPQRLAQEVALMADRSDIAEELTRLRVHSAELSTLLQAGGELGKKLDFLSQEMNRETNTILSKTGGIGEIGLGITGMALAVRSEIDKIREQALNLE